MRWRLQGTRYRRGLTLPKVVARRAINFGKVCAVKSDTLEDSEGNGEVRKKGGRVFDEKRL